MKNAVLRRFLVILWENTCVICGNEFVDQRSATIEHIVPRRCILLSSKGLRENKAPSHLVCNNLRGRRSIIATAKLIEQKRDQMTPKAFTKWLNRPVRHRNGRAT